MVGDYLDKEKSLASKAAEITKKIFNDYYDGDPKPWFSYLCTKSVYTGTGEPLLFVGDAIKEHFRVYSGRKVEVVQEEYHSVDLGDDCALVFGGITVESSDGAFLISTRFSYVYRLIDGEIKLIHQHNSYTQNENSEYENFGGYVPNINTMQFVRRLLIDSSSSKRIPIKSGKQTIFINTNSILYVQGQRKRTEIVCVDRIISCNTPLGKLSKELTNVFYPIHRSYIVNTLYIVAVRRFEVELVSGITVPIPPKTYSEIKAKITEIISNRSVNSDD